MKEQFLQDINDHKGIIFKVCRMYCFDALDREDLFQDIVLQIWRSYGVFKKESKVSTWMYRIAINTAITRLRKETRKVVPEELGREALQIAENDNAQERERLEMMYQAIGKLTDIEKAIVMLYMDDYSYKEIAAVIGITESNVGFKLNKLKMKLKTTVNTN